MFQIDPQLYFSAEYSPWTRPGLAADDVWCQLWAAQTSSANQGSSQARDGYDDSSHFLRECFQLY